MIKLFNNKKIKKSINNKILNSYKLTPKSLVMPSQTRADWMLRDTQNWYIILLISSLLFPNLM